MADSAISKDAPPEINENSSAPEVSVFAVHGTDPEVQAYAMAKYSRSALSMKESLREISGKKAEEFLNTFYFQYGHRSIADLAHIAIAVEKLSILAAIILVDEQRWDGQERSTRYQNFKKSGYYVPDFGADATLREQYCAAAAFLFTEYEAFSQEMLRYYRSRVEKPADMTDEAYTRTLRARAFDSSRYLLPLATNTSLGQIVNARSLETQIARLLSSPYAEVRILGDRLKQAAREPAFNVHTEALRSLVEELKAADAALGARVEEQLLRPVRVAPTLVKYANASEYEIKTRPELAQAAAELMQDAPVRPAPLVDLVDHGPLEVELAATMIYSACRYPYRQVRERVEALTAARRDELIELGLRYRGRFDEVSRLFHAGQQFCFDILMDIGGFRDMHRHRRCTQIQQGFTGLHGYDTPPDLMAAGLGERYAAAMERVERTRRQLDARFNSPGHARPAVPDFHDPGQGDASLYLLPLAFRKRTLFKMDFAEALYIAELRSAPAGHFSYRAVAYAMYQEVARKHPSLAGHFRVGSPVGAEQPADILKR